MNDFKRENYEWLKAEMHNVGSDIKDEKKLLQLSRSAVIDSEKALVELRERSGRLMVALAKWEGKK